MKWESVCGPKDFGGLGIINTRHMNIALLMEWIWKLFSCVEDYPWLEIISNKYLKHGDIVMNTSRGSQFWKVLHDVKNGLF
jgi:hypothetical protein